MKIELSLREFKILLKWRKMQNATQTGGMKSPEKDHVVQILQNWHADQGEKPMPLWKFKRRLHGRQGELLPALENLVGEGLVEFIMAPTKGRPLSGYRLAHRLR